MSALACLSGQDAKPEGPGRTAGVCARPQRQADRLLALAEKVPLFQAADGVAHADLEIGGHRETWAVRSRRFRLWLIEGVLARGGGVPSSKALHDALDMIEARALSAGPVHDVKVRLGELDGRIYLDLGDATWRAVEVDAEGWRIVERPPLRFRRPAGAQALPAPEHGGSMAALHTLLDFPDDIGLATAVAWLIAALRDRGPYPVLVLAGEAGAGKSTFMAMLQALIDPSVAHLRSLPRGEPALLRAAHDSHVLAFDNLSSLPGWLSDALCRMVSDGGYASRRNGGAAEVGLAGVARPVMMNGIADIVTRPDLADRALFVTLNGIQPRNRRTEAELWAGFEAARPRLLGALLDAVVGGLRRLPKTTLAEAPRMADLARWVEACEPTLFKPGAFKTIYLGNRNGAARDAIECDAFVDAARDFAWRTKTWFGTATDLYRQMAPLAAGDDGWGRAWPGNARALASRLRQGAAFLRRCGVEVAFDRARLGTRIISLAVAVNGASDANRPADANPGTASPGASPASA